MSKSYISDEKVNEQFIQYINRNLPLYHHMQIDGFKVGGSELAIQKCQVSAGFNKDSKNQYIHIMWLALFFGENIKLREEKNNFMDRLGEGLEKSKRIELNNEDFVLKNSIEMILHNERPR